MVTILLDSGLIMCTFLLSDTKLFHVDMLHCVVVFENCHSCVYVSPFIFNFMSVSLLPFLFPYRSTGFSEVIVVVGGCERMGGFNLPYTECYDPVTGEWKSLAKLPEFTKSEYAVCALRNDILVSGKSPVH